MPFIEAPTTFYLGRRYDPEAGRLVDEVVYYDSRDLTTHAVVVGMTGSGKTGMCITLLEEAVLDNIPAIVIDPKGDITNLLLTFPNLQPADFAPWINASDAQRAGMEIEEYAQDVAQQWRDGLASWSIVPGRIAALKNAAQFSIYTPGSDAGLPISILASFRAPREGWVGHEEFHREQINGIVRALMALIGKQVEPVKDREHVLVSNIFEEAWKAGHDLTLEDIILQVQNPPFSRLGVFDVNTFFPEKDRFKLAKELNNIIASPTFQTWISGEPLEVRRLMYTPEGRPRVAIFYLAHLTEAERTFMITLILENMLAWMRSLSGTTSLRALMYFDEVFGHFPPYPKNPPTKDPLLRLLKQARAFGIGMVLATQNPGDLDYKGLSNAGTWFIGKLQTENDKRRVMSGLETVSTANAKLDLTNVDKLLSSLAPRVFLLHNVHDDGGPILMHSRWAMSYLRGPLTRQQVRVLMEPQRQALGINTPRAPVPQGTAPQPAAPQDIRTYTPSPSAKPPLPGERPAAFSLPAQPVQRSTPPPPPLGRTGAQTPPPLPEAQESRPVVTPPPAAIPEAPGSRTASTPPPAALPEAGSQPPTPPPSATPPPSGGFLDRLAKEIQLGDQGAADAPPSQGTGAFAPRNPFQFTQSAPAPSQQPTPPAPQVEEPPLTASAGASAFWLTPPGADEALPQPPAPEPEAPDEAASVRAEWRYEGETQPPGLGYTQPSLAGTGTQPAPPLPEGYAERPPALESSVAQFYLPTTVTTQQAIRQWEQKMGYTTSTFGGAQLLYQPVLLAQLVVRYIDRKSGVETDQYWAFQVPNVESAGFIRWQEYLAPAVPLAQLGSEPFGTAFYGALSAGLTNAKRMRALRDEVIDYVARTATLTLYYNSTLDLYGQPGEDMRDFVARAQQIAREKRDQEIDEVTAKYDKQLEALELRLRREMRQLTGDKEVLGELRREDLYTTGEAVLSLLRGRTTYTLSRMSRARRYKKQAQEKALASEQNVINIEEQIEATQEEVQKVLKSINDKWGKIAQSVEEYKVKPFKKDIALEAYGIGWVPLWQVVINNQPLLLPAFVGNPDVA